MNEKIYNEVMERTKWYRDARFGMFIHWGLYSVAARHEWVRHHERLTDEDYEVYFDNFTAENYNPKEWAKLAKQAGMKYAVLTTKHHEGFCLFDSKYTDYKATNTPAKRDLVKEFVEAFRNEGIKIGFYYSLLDWHHPDYPHETDAKHPLRENKNYPDDKRNFENYKKYMYNQIEELCTNYGKIDLFWFDFSYVQPNGEVMGDEKWGAKEIVQLVRKHHPDVIIDNRLTIDEGNKELSEISGDFKCPEQRMPNEPILLEGKPFPWELCMTMQKDSWGYVANNDCFMNAKDVIHTLVECVSKDGNLLLNVGPTAKGDLPEKIVETLTEVGKWMYYNKESIYGCGHTMLKKQNFGYSTGKGGVIYLHFFDKPTQYMEIEGLGNIAKYAFMLKDMSEFKICYDYFGGRVTNNSVIFDFPTPSLPDQIDTVIKVILK